MNPIPSIAIVGAGFTGTMLAVQLATQSRTPLHITLYDAAGQFARGVAYSTQDHSHLLNVRADRMGAFNDKQDHFYDWLLEHEIQWRAAHPELRDLKIMPEDFMPRVLYGDYIASLFKAAQSNSLVTIETVQAEVTDAESTKDGVTITLADESQHKFTHLILALGSLPVAQHGITESMLSNPHYVSALWTPLPGSILTQENLQQEAGPVLIIGTGLTTIDAIVSLRGRGYSGKIIAVSRHGLLPQPHIPLVASYPPFIKSEKAPRTAFELLRAVRSEITRAKEGWRSVIDSLRADTPALWAQLPENERRKSLRLLSFWNVHRHRMPPSSAKLVADEKMHGTLAILKGRVEKIREDENVLTVQIREPNGQTKLFRVAHVINCSGPEMNIAKSRYPLLKNLLKRDAIKPGPLNLGFAAEQNGRLKGSAAERIFALGPLLVGERLETVAVPELRKQASDLAQTLLATI